MKQRCNPILKLSILLLLSILPCTVEAQTWPAHQVFVVLTPGLRAEDLISPLLPALRRLRNTGAAGWMVCRAARAPTRRQLAPDGRDTALSLALTLGSGTRALAEEKKEEKPQGEDSPISPFSPSISSLRDINHTVDHAVPIGALGGLIHRAGWHTALLGSVQADGTFAMGQLLAMDGTGQIDVMPTAVNNLAQLYKGAADVSAPYGRRDNVQALLTEAVKLDARTALVVIAFGDLARADRYAPLCLPAQAARQRENALRALNELIAGLQQHLTVRHQNENSSALTPPSRLYLLSPAPALSTTAADKAAPVCVWGEGVPVGTLTSPSTRTTGIVVNTDFLPAIAADLGLPPPSGAIGRPFEVQSTLADSTVLNWAERHDRLLQSERLKDVYGGLPTGQTLLVLSALWAFRKRSLRLTGALAIVIVALPLGMLLLPPLPFVPHSVLGAGLMLTAFVFLFAFLAWGAYSPPSHLRALLLSLCAVLIAAIVLDLLTGSRLLRAAWMSYSIMETARFYGIGNEYMGTVIGAACILLGCLGQGERGKGKREVSDSRAISAAELSPAVSSNEFSSAQHKPNLLFPFPFSLFLLLFSLLLTFILGYNRFGAKVGAVPSVGCALGVEMLMLWRGRVRMRDVSAIMAGAALLLGVLILLDMRHAAGEQSHLARAFLGGGGNILAIARRKLSLEGCLLLHSPWSLALLCASGTFWAAGRERRAQIQQPEFKIVPAGLMTGVVVSLLCNDSGVTAAAMLMLFGCAWALIESILIASGSGAPNGAAAPAFSSLAAKRAEVSAP